MRAKSGRGMMENELAARSRFGISSWAALALAASVTTQLATLGSASAAQTDVEVSMAGAPTTPRILPPREVAARPNTDFLFTLPVTGQGPFTYAATGLPAGLTLSATGTISGKMPAAGSYPVAVTVTSAAGMAQATLTILSSETLSPTPPMGWNSYDSFGGGVTERETLDAAEAQKSILQPYGWHYVVVDYLWFDNEQRIDGNGRFLPSTQRFPNNANGFQDLAKKIHDMGLGFGIHIMRGIPRKAVTANSRITGPNGDTSFTAQQAANTGDICPWDNHMYGVRGDTEAGQAWYDSIFAQYASWGIDFVKVDDMLHNQVTPHIYHQAEVNAIRKAIDKTGRSIVLSLSPGPMLTSSSANLNTNANMWRMVNDFWDKNGLSNLTDVFDAAGSWQAVSGITKGHWPDADMLPLGYIGPRAPVGGASRQTALSHNAQVTVMSLWGILPSPLMFGGNVPGLKTQSSGAFTIALLTNEEVIAVNQDALGTRGKRIAKQGTTEVWAKDLSGGAKAVALFNRGTQDATVTATFAQLGVTGMPTVRDLWRKADVTGMTTGLSVNVPHEGALMYKLSPPSTGSGGAGGTGGTGGVGGSAGSTSGGTGGTIGGAGGSTGGAGASAGGSGGVAGQVGSGGSTDGGVAGTATGSGGVIGSGGSSGGVVSGAVGGVAPSTGGSSAGTNQGASGSAAAGSGGSDGEDSGCSFAGAPRGSALLAALAALGSALLLRRRRSA